MGSNFMENSRKALSDDPIEPKILFIAKNNSLLHIDKQIDTDKPSNSEIENSMIKIANRQNRLNAASAEISLTLKDQFLKDRLDYYYRRAGKVIILNKYSKR